MNVHEQQHNEQGIFDNYNELQRDLLRIELRKTRNKILIIALILFLSDMLGLMISNYLTFQLFLWSLIIPVILGCLAFLSAKEPLAAMIIASVIILGLWIYVISLTGSRGALSGFAVKIVVIGLLFGGFQSAREAQRIKKTMV